MPSSSMPRSRSPWARRGLVICSESRSTPPSCSATRAILVATVSGSPMKKAPSGPLVASNWARDGGEKPRSRETLSNSSCQPG
ncbi:hypothetical protein [Blastococcus brunescens]|uniref:Uncharacterized protein n=1 Tax=Blastococcus brunescens TaxID=1564165 RepID=A0ABZ1B715_9ACTN|nr:hypothetical protein [Blastococcus sp. BMG 8361]WRL66605.1 hypothetical protein U6N30_15105 [Blastococcus sp. BMG 8361]